MLPASLPGTATFCMSTKMRYESNAVSAATLREWMKPVLQYLVLTRCSYWDWALDWEDITKSPVLDYTNGFGGNGNTSIKEPFLDGFCLTEGPFSRLEMPYIGADYKPHCLSRGFPNREKLARLGQDLRPEALGKVLSLTDYESFNLGLENGPHLAVPKMIRGDFQYFTAPNGLCSSGYKRYVGKLILWLLDPLFFLHHAQLDRLWWTWQKTDRGEKQTEYLGKAVRNSTDLALTSDVIPMGGLAAHVQVSEILSTETELLCYRY